MEQKLIYQNLPIRIKTGDEETIWFAGIDVCNILGYSRPNNVIRENLDDDEKKLMHVTDASGQNRKAWMINEPGLYNLILSSSKPEAKAFRRWVIHEVLPSIRKAGKYTTQQEQDKQTQLNLKVLEIEKVKTEIADHQTLVYDGKRQLQRLQIELNELIKSDSSQLIIPFPKKKLQ